MNNKHKYLGFVQCVGSMTVTVRAVVHWQRLAITMEHFKGKACRSKFAETENQQHMSKQEHFLSYVLQILLSIHGEKIHMRPHQVTHYCNHITLPIKQL